jgi:hypothetical protein
MLAHYHIIDHTLASFVLHFYIISHTHFSNIHLIIKSTVLWYFYSWLQSVYGGTSE